MTVSPAAKVEEVRASMYHLSCAASVCLLLNGVLCLWVREHLSFHRLSLLFHRLSVLFRRLSVLFHRLPVLYHRLSVPKTARRSDQAMQFYHGVHSIYHRKTLPLPCPSTDFVAKTLPYPAVSSTGIGLATMHEPSHPIPAHAYLAEITGA